MSGIYIKGMEMPKGCYHCAWMFRDKPNGKVYCTATETNSNIFAADQWLDVSDVLAENRHPNCPLVPVPPHGRLIDADRMKESIKKQTAFLRLIGGEFAEIAETLEKGFLQEIDNAPTIIPAEEAGAK